MNDNMVVDAAGVSEAERNTLLIAYVLFCATFVTGFAGIAGVILCHIKVGESGNEFLRSHYRWLIRTFWFTLLWAVVCGVLVASIIFAVLGGIGFAALFVWHLYRLIRGLVTFSERRPMPV
ncbi:MAG TPA: hypothetical protein VFA75_14485 [Nevskia sp.]|nr:hypothetical protein [Nevskia sp.]